MCFKKKVRNIVEIQGRGLAISITFKTKQDE